MKSEEMKIESRIRRRNEKQMVGFMESRIRRRNDKEIVGFEATEVDFVTPMLGFLFYVILLSFHLIRITFIPIESVFSYGCFLVFGIHLLYNLSTERWRVRKR